MSIRPACAGTAESWISSKPSTKALEYSITQEDFITNMEIEGYEVIWMPNRKHITFTCPNRRKCRDSSLHDETFLKENLEMLLACRQATGFRPQTAEPDKGWMGELADSWLQVMADRSTMPASRSPHHQFGQTANSAAGKR